MRLLITILFLCFSSLGFADGHKKPIKIGILHSLSGTMAISETTSKVIARSYFQNRQFLLS